MDADGSHDAALLPAMLAEIDNGAELVIGSRYIAGGSIPDWPWRRRVLSSFGNRYATRALRLPVRDGTGGYRAYRAELLDRIAFDEGEAIGYAVHIEMTFRCHRSGAKVTEVPILFRDRTLGRSKMSPRIVVETFRLVTGWALAERFGRVRLGRPADESLRPAV
jgi:dolichol-phosphate mannosyltransferase